MLIANFFQKTTLQKIYAPLLVFTIAFGVRVLTLNDMGRTWDEEWYVSQGNKYIEAVRHLDFQNEIWYKDPDQPPLGKYLYGLASYLDSYPHKGITFFYYDLTYARLLSAIIGSLSVLIVFILSLRYLSLSIAIFSSVILALLPIFVGLSQLVTLESPIMLFFTLAVLCFLWLLEKPTVGKAIITGVVLACAVSTKITNILLLPLLAFAYVTYVWRNKKYKLPSYRYAILLILIIAVIIFIALWPAVILYPNQIIEYTVNLRGSQGVSSPPETFFGIFMPTPIIYYIVYFFITTPLLILFLTIFGIKKMFNEKKWIYFVILFWFFFPFIQSFYNFRQNGIRYIIEIYAPLSIIAGIGLDRIITNYMYSKKARAFFLLALASYLLFVNLRISPYYLNYFNMLVGGPSFVYQHNLFHLGWWGDGLREAGIYLEKNAPVGSTIGVRTNPTHTLYKSNSLKYSIYQEGEEYDYIVVNYYAIIREFFDDSVLQSNYVSVYNVLADGAVLATIYKHK